MKEIVATKNAPGAIGPYSQANVLGNMVYTSGQIALIPATGEMAENDIKVQTRQVLTNLKAVLEAAGSDLTKVVKTTVFLSDIANFGAMNEIYGEFFGTEGCPARSAVQVAALPKNAMVEIECIAHK